MKPTIADTLRMKMYRMAHAEMNRQHRLIGELIVRDGSNADPAELSELVKNAKTVKGMRDTIQELL